MGDGRHGMTFIARARNSCPAQALLVDVWAFGCCSVAMDDFDALNALAAQVAGPVAERENTTSPYCPPAYPTCSCQLIQPSCLIRLCACVGDFSELWIVSRGSCGFCRLLLGVLAFLFHEVVAPAVASDDSDGLEAMEGLAPDRGRRPRDADLAERARVFKQKKKSDREKEQMRQTLCNARNKVRELRPGVLTTFVPSDICLQGFTRAFKGVRLSPEYSKLQNFIMSLLASGIEYTQAQGLEQELQRALQYTRAGGSVIVGSEVIYDETNQRLTVPIGLAKGRLAGSGSGVVEKERIKNMTCPVLVREASVHVEYIPGGDRDVEDGNAEAGVREFGCSGDREEYRSSGVQPWILRPHIMHGKTAQCMLTALSSQWPLHVSCPEFAILWERYLRDGTRVLVDVDNRDDAAANRLYVAMAAREAQEFFEQVGCPHRQVRHSHRCDIHQAQLMYMCLSTGVKGVQPSLFVMRCCRTSMSVFPLSICNHSCLGVYVLVFPNQKE